MNSIGLGIHGTGMAADHHAYALAKSSKFSLVAVSDDKVASSRDYARRHHVDKYYGDLEYLLSDGSVDIVIVASPTPYHSSIFPYIASTGRSVIMETPLASNLEDARKIVKTAEKEGIFLFPVSQMPSEPLMKYVYSLIKGGTLGIIEEYTLSWSFSSPVKRWMSNWGEKEKCSERGLFLESASPAFDLVSFLFDKERVTWCKEIERGVEVSFGKGRLSIEDGGSGFSFFIRGERGEIEGKNGKLISVKIDREDGKRFDTETIKSPYSPLPGWYDDVYSALESGVWSEEKYKLPLKSLEFILETGKYFG